MKFGMKDWINIVISLIITAGIYYAYNYLNEGIGTILLPILFFVVLIYLKLSDMEKRK